MMRKLLLCLVMIGFGMFLTTSQALAINVSTLTGGDLQIHFQNIDEASLYASPLDPRLGDGNMDSFALITVTDINRLSNNSPIWQQNSTTPGEYLTGMFYGLRDLSATITTVPGVLSTQIILSTGGTIDLYLNDNSVNPLGGNAPALVGTAAPGDLWDATSANLFLRLEIVPGTYVATATTLFATGAVSGGSSGYLKVTGGSAMSVFNNDAYNSIYPGADMVMNNGFRNLDPAIAAELAQIKKGWNLSSTGNVTQPGVIPEPASMTLLGLGLAGLARLRRRG